MIKTQIQLEDWQYNSLNSLKHAGGAEARRSLSDVDRVDRFHVEAKRLFLKSKNIPHLRLMDRGAGLDACF